MNLIMGMQNDDLNAKSTSEVTRLIPEELSMIKKIIKFSKRKLEQERTIALSRCYIYNLSKKILKRTINVLTVEGISISDSSNQFTLHIPSEFDVRYKSISRDKLIYEMLKMKSVMGDKTTIPLFIVRNSSLDSITTTEDDINNGIRKSLLADHKMVDHYTFGLYIYKHFNSIKNKQILYVSEDHLSNCTQRDYRKLMKIGNSSICTTSVLKCFKLNQVFTCKSFNKKYLTIELEAFRAMTRNYQQNKYAEKLLSAKETEDQFELVFQYCEGDMYGQLKAQITLAEEYILHIAIRLIFVVEKTESILYTLNPENILYDRSGNPKSSILQSYFLSTSPNEYCSPQQLQFYQSGTPIKHPLMVNIWRLGVTLYELAYGVPPFPLIQILSAVTTSRQFTLKFPRQYKSLQFQSFLSSLLKLNPQTRSGFKNPNKLFLHPWFQNIDLINYQKQQFKLQRFINKLQIEDNYSQRIEYYLDFQR